MLATIHRTHCTEQVDFIYFVKLILNLWFIIFAHRSSDIVQRQRIYIVICSCGSLAVVACVVVCGGGVYGTTLKHG